MNLRYRILCLVVPFLAPALYGHTISLTYAEATVDEHQIRWSLRMPVPELDLLLGLDQNHDGNIDAAELTRSTGSIQQYVVSKVSVLDNGRQVTGAVRSLQPWKDSEGHPFIQVDMVFSAPAGKSDRVTLRCDMLRDVVASHQTLAKITAGGQTRDFVFENGRSFEINTSPSTFETVLQFVRMGILHIFTGYDHIAFLIGVVLIGGSFKTILKVVTSFTVAHSITLALATFNLISIPSRWVESAIALSIMYIAVENLLFKAFDRRWVITFFFGLVHGFGFASALQEVHLPQHMLATALVSFNLGVEAGQLCIVAVLLPGLLYISRLRFHETIVRGCSAVIFLLGSFWLWQRVSGV
jgi:hydrogenase/urease accessory protein HupE